MQLGLGKTLFPSWAASVTLVKDHGTSAVQHAAAAVRAGDGGSRLDHAVRAMTSFDHAVDNTGKLPVDWLVPGAKKYIRGYEIAKQAVTLLVASNLIPGARERVSRQSLLAAKDTFLAGVEASRTERGRFGRHLAGGWLEATAEDALTGVSMLQDPATGRALLAGINQVRSVVSRGNQLDDALVRSVGTMFDQAAGQLLALERASARQPMHAVDGSAWAQSGVLLEQVEAAAREMVADATAAQAKLDERAAG